MSEISYLTTVEPQLLRIRGALASEESAGQGSKAETSDHRILSRQSNSSDDTVDTCPIDDSVDLSHRMSVDTVFSQASSFSDVTIAPALKSPFAAAFGEVALLCRTISTTPSLESESTDTSLGSPLSSPPIPPKRPPRLRRPPRAALATQQDAPMNLDRYGTFFTRFEPPASPIESTPGCSRGDSMCLDPDLASEIAKKVMQAEQQNLEQASTVPLGTRRLDSPAASASLLFSDVTESKADGRYWINAASEHTHASTSSLGTLRHSASRVPLASAFSNSSDEGCNTNGTYEAAMHRRRHAPRAQKGKTLISRAFKKFGTNRVVSDLGPSRSQDDLVNWSRSTRDMCSSPALSILSATSSPDIRSRRISSESDLSSAGPCSRASTPIQYSSPVFGRHRLAQQVAFEETEELMDDGVTASPRMAPDGYFDTMVDSHVHLPSYHRGLRKQIYPPRVRYELRDTPSPVASPQMQQQQLPSPHASPSQWTTKLAGIHSHSFEPVRAGSPRLDFAGPRRFGTS
ncbi:hypothetical protein L1887_53530 [Cichorium endivia]|nr:hypothetical protein L1887_53530 [Cichorium endivia]